MNIQNIRLAETLAGRAIDNALSFASETDYVTALNDAKFLLAEVRHFAQTMHAINPESMPGRNERQDARDALVARLMQSIIGNS